MEQESNSLLTKEYQVNRDRFGIRFLSLAYNDSVVFSHSKSYMLYTIIHMSMEGKILWEIEDSKYANKFVMPTDRTVLF